MLTLLTYGCPSNNAFFSHKNILKQKRTDVLKPFQTKRLKCLSKKSLDQCSTCCCTRSDYQINFLN